MSIETSCPHCGTEYQLADTQAGKKVACKTCNQGFVVRTAPARDEEEDRPRSGRDDPDDRPRRRRDEEDDDRPRSRRRDKEDRPRRRPRPGGGGMVWLIVGLSVGGVVVIGLVVLLAGGGGLGTQVTTEKAEKIREGMTEAEVVAILGVGESLDNARRRNARGLATSKFAGMFDGQSKYYEGAGDHFFIVTFQDGKVNGHAGRLPPKPNR